MKVGEVAFETIGGEYRNIFVPVKLNDKKQIIVPSLQYDDYETNEITNLFDFRVQKRGSSRRIIAKCALKSQCSTPRVGLEDTPYFLPNLRKNLFLGDILPIVLVHTFGHEQIGNDDMRPLIDEIFSEPSVGLIQEINEFARVVD